MNVKKCFIDSSEMPNSCRECRFRHKFIQGKWYWSCLLSADVDINNDNRPSDCPLVAIDAIVPDINDGDTINRQAAIEALCSVCGNDCDKTEFVYDAPQWDQVIMCPEHYVLTTLPSAQSEI